MIRLADYLTNFLKEKGVKNVFMLSGTGSIHLDDAFAYQKGIKFICVRHEAAAAIMAEASAKLTGNIGVVVSTTGPGGTNAIGGVVEAWVDSVPILVISGQVYTKQISQDVRSFGVQGFNIIENIAKITKYSAQINDPYKIKYHLDKALHMATEGRPGPVWLDIPFDIQSAKIDTKKLQGFEVEKYVKTSIKSEIKKALSLINKSKKPVVAFGQGIRQAKAIEEFKLFLNIFKIPAISARMGLDILPYNNKFYCGLGGMKGQKASASIIKECDLIIAIGTSFTHTFAGQNYDQFNSEAKLIMVNIDSYELNKKGLKVDLPINVNLKDFIIEITEEYKKNNHEIETKQWLEKCKLFKKKMPTVLSSFKKNPINSYYFIEKLNEHAKNKTIFVNDAGSSNYICSQALKIKEGQRELTSGAFYSMGLALPLAIGASVTEPQSDIIAVTGDGSIELNIQELRTMSLNNLNIKLFIINNGGYASIRKSQDDMVGGRYTDDEEVLNFSNIAKAFELEFHIIQDYLDFDKKIPEILSKKGPALIEVVCDKNQEILTVFSE